MSLSVNEAIERLGNVTNKDELRDLILQLSVDSPGKVTMLYSGQAGAADGSKVSAREIALSIAANDNNVRIVDKTDIGRFLNVDGSGNEANVALIDTLKRIFGDSPDNEGSEAHRFLYGDVVDGKRVPNGVWDIVSERFVAATNGAIRTITGGANADRAFAQTEVPAILRSDGITSVDGIAIEELKAKTPQQAFEAIRAQSEVKSAELLISVDADGKPLHIQGTIHVDTRNFFADTPGMEGTQPSGDLRMRQLADFIPAERLQEHIQGLEELRKSKENLTNQLSELHGPEHETTRLRILRSLDQLGNAADVLSLAIVALEAQKAYEAGNIQKSRDLLSAWIIENTAALAAGRLASLALAPLIAAGPPGVLVAGSLTVLASMVGGAYGNDVWKWFIDLLQGWDDKFRDEMSFRFKNIQYMQSPLILDLNGDGVRTLSRSGMTRYFNHDGDGFSERTGWVAPDDGLLVRDLNGNEVIDSGAELFGNNTLLSSGRTAQDGFEALQDLDENYDGVIDSLDSAWQELLIWRDADSDASVDGGELLRLEQAGVKSLNVAAKPFTESIYQYTDRQGNRHYKYGTYTTTSDIVRDMTDVWFSVDIADTALLNPVQISERIAALPDIDGMGNVPSLHQAMAADASGVLQSLVEQWIEADSYGRSRLLEPILYHWAGVQNLSPIGNEPLIKDARHLAVLEKFVGSSFKNQFPVIGIVQANQLEALFQSTALRIENDLYASVELKPFLNQLTTAWNSERQKFELDVSKSVEYMRGKVIGIDTIQKQLKSARALKALLPEPIRSSLMLEIGNAAAREPWNFGSFLLALGADKWIRETQANGNDSLVDSASNSLLDGLNGNDKLYGGAGNDTLCGGPGDDYFSDNEGRNTFVFGRGDGKDLIQDSHSLPGKAHNTLQFRGDISQDEVIVSAVSQGYDLLLAIGETGDQIVIRNFMRIILEGSFQTSLQRVRFADGTEWGVDEIVSRLYAGSPRNDYLLGSDAANSIMGEAGADTISSGPGNDTLVGGTGDDSLLGGEGFDVYRFAKGDGNDRIMNTDTSLAKLDAIELTGGLLPGDLSVDRVAEDLRLSINGASDSIVVEKFFKDDAASSSRVEEVRFADGLVWDVEAIKALAIKGNPNSQLLIGYATSDVILAAAGDDTVYGNAGNDILHGGFGMDKLIGGPGQDTLSGGLGQDTLDGGAGRDVLIGGFGGDHFRFSALSDSGSEPESLDWIMDFQRDDLIDLSMIDGDASLAGRQPFSFIGASAFTAPAQVRYTSANGVGALMANVNATLEADFHLQILGGMPLVSSNLIL